MRLLVSLKDKVAKDLGSNDLGNAFRQIENWANSVRWTTLTLAANWSVVTTDPLQVTLDSLGFIRLYGSASYTGAQSINTAYLLTTLPNPLRPNRAYNALPGTFETAVNGSIGDLQILTSGVVNLVPRSSAVTNGTWVVSATYPLVR